MNVFGKRERGWRKKRKRGVSPIIATILLVAITVVLAAVLYVLITGLTTGGANSTPIGGSFSTSAAQQSSNSNCGTTTIAAGTCYSAQVQTAGSSATTANIHFTVATASAPTSSFTVFVTDASGTLISQYTPGTGWTGGTLPATFAVGYYIYLSYTGSTPSTIVGYSFQAIGVGGLNGAYTISPALP